jgi:hypothetical protein
MTFLLFVASVAVLEYLLKGAARQKAGTTITPANSQMPEDGIQADTTSTEDLLSICRALDAQPRPPVPDPERVSGGKHV